MPILNYFSLSLLVGSIAALSSGIFVYLKNRQRLVNKTCFLLSVSTAIWSIGYLGMIVAKTKAASWYYNWTLHTAAIFIVPFFIHFIFALINEFDKRKKELYFVYLSSILFLVLNPTRLFIQDMKPKFVFNYCCDAGPLYILFALHFFVWAVYGLYRVFKAIKASAGIRNLQLKYVLLASAAGFIGGGSVFLLTFNISFPPYPLILFTFYPILTTYAIVKYRLMDINIVLTRAGIFAFVYTLVLGLPFGVGVLVKGHLSKVTSNWWLLPMFLLVVLASAGPFIYMKLQKRIEFRLRAEEFKSHEALRRLSHNMLRFTNLDDLLKLIVHQLVKILKLKFAAIYLFDNQANKYILKDYWRPMQSLESSFEPPVEFSKNSSLIKDLYLRRIPVVTEELRLFAPKALSSHIRALVGILSHLGANTVIPSFLRNGLIGFVVLSDRRANIPFTQEDLNLLMVLSNEAALAVENAQFHQKEKMELMERSRREALADMAPGASHQFNNRLVSISSSAELLLLKLENIKIDEVKDENLKALLKDTKAALEDIDKEVYKGKEITSAILKRAKAKVDFQEVDVPKLIENAHRLVLISHSRSGLERFKEPRFNLTCLNEIPNIFGSEALLQDCFYNLIDNSFDAIHEAIQQKTTSQGEVEISLMRDNTTLTVQIKDNGIGLKKENIRKLFTPYFTTKATSNKGSGLGLYVIRDFIEMHEGIIRCDSEYGKGTTFTIRLPMKKKRKNVQR